MLLNIYLAFIFLIKLDKKLEAIHYRKQDTDTSGEQHLIYNEYIDTPYCVSFNPNGLTKTQEYLPNIFVSDSTIITQPLKLNKQNLLIDILKNDFRPNNANKGQKNFLFHISSNYNKNENYFKPLKYLKNFGGNIFNQKQVHLVCPQMLLNKTYIKTSTNNNKHKRFSQKKLSPELVRRLQSTNMKKYIDFTTNPCTDFYQFACGNWIKYNPISKDKTGYDIFEMLRENIDELIKDLLGNHSKLNMDKYNCTTDYKKQLGTTTVMHKYKKNIKRSHKIFLKTISNKTRIVSDRIFQQMKRFKFKIKQKQINKKYIETKRISAEIKAKILFQSCMNVKILKQRGIKPLLDLLKELGGWPVLDKKWSGNNFHWLNLTAHLRLFNNDIFILEWVAPDLKNSNVNIIQLDQANLGLPSRDFFLNESNTLYVSAYKEFMISIMKILGADNTSLEQTADDLIKFETNLANITTSPDDRINFSIIYNRMSILSLCEQIPDIDWNLFLSIIQERCVNNHETVVVYAINYFKRLSMLIKNTKTEIIANYILWRFVVHRINNLDNRFKDCKQRFFHILFGREQNPPRWKNCVAQVNSNMGMAVGAMFVRKYFDESSKEDTVEMALNLQEAFLDILNETTWLDNITKNLAVLKLKAMSWKIGYPDFILSQTILDEKYETLEIIPNLYFENTLNVLKHITKTEQIKLNIVVDKNMWQIAPAVVNAYYSRNKNQILFPAGILQPPFYHRYFPRSLNYGGIGVVIGHELTHGFDDKGRLFDGSGNIEKWWSDYAIYEFHKRAKCIISQYGNYTVEEVDVIIDGERTQGENIADNGGIKQAFHAYKKWLKNHFKSNEKNEIFPNLNLTNTQLFYLNFAQIWCGSIRSEALRSKIKTAVHSPGKFRVIGSLSNSIDFAREFRCPLGSPMNPIVKCSVW